MCEAVHLSRERRGGGLELEAVLADVAELGHADDPSCGVARPPRHTGDQTEATREPAKLPARHLGDDGVLGPLDDGCQHPVDVEEQRRPLGLGREKGERIHLRRVGAVAGTMKLVGIGVAAGFLGALFGVGGGIVIVPLLMTFVAFDQRRAGATSLAAILLSSAAGAITYAAHGDVEVGPAMLVGVPAVVGVIAGVDLQQRLAQRTLGYAFAVLVAAVGVKLIL